MSQKASGLLSAATHLLELVTASWTSQATFTAAELGIADLLAEGPMGSEELAAATSTHEPSLHRLLRALVTIDICRERDDGTFEITAMGSMLGSHSRTSLRSWTLWWGSHQWPVWGQLLHSVQTGESARTSLGDADGFGHLTIDSQAAALFHRAMIELTRLVGEAVVRAYDFSGINRVVDVGGGYGELLACILEAHPSISGVLFDLPHAMEGAKKHLESTGLAARCEFVAGDFFASVPSGADAYVLKSVIHDWNDERSAQILGTCRRAMTLTTRLILVERILPEKLDISPAHQSVARSDLHMLLAHAGRERTEAEFRALLSSTGLQATRIDPTDTMVSVIEAHRTS